MPRFITLNSLIFISAWLCVCTLLANQKPDQIIALDDLNKRSTTEIQNLIRDIENELDELAAFTMRSGVGSIGFRSDTHETSLATEWVRIDLGEPYLLDAITLVPTIWRSPKKGLTGDAFPTEFRILCGTAQDQEGIVIAEYTERDEILPRIAPLTIPISPIEASWIQIEATKLTTRAWDKKYILQFSEILAFRGPENVALNKRVTTSSGVGSLYSSRRPEFLVDGFLPYLMDTAKGIRSLAYVSPTDAAQQPAITIDLGQPEDISQINLHSVDVTDTIPQASSNDYAIPKHMIVEAALEPDFSDAVTIVDYRDQSLFDAGPIIMRRFETVRARYFRFTALEPYLFKEGSSAKTLIGFAEIEVLKGETNYALGAQIQLNFEAKNERKISAITDGRNLYGTIMPLRAWLIELERRHELEKILPELSDLLNQRYAQQERNLNRMLWAIAFLITATIIIILIDRNIRQRAVYQTRERIAADLHDELGANLHAIGLLSELANKSQSNPAKLSGLLTKLRNLTVRTSSAARHCTNMLEAKELYEDLVSDMRRTASRLLADLDHEIIFEGEALLKELSPRKRLDLYLFHKEALTNIIRHSAATRVRVKLTASRKAINLVITDNGLGILKNLNNGVPKSLSRRSRLLGARVQVCQPEEGTGTQIILRINNLKFAIIK